MPAIWLVVGVALIEVLKNTVFEPFVVGESVDVHPLVIFIGVLAGGLMFGAVGLLLALPRSRS
jgi:predicted PurR-regulated permease PerM